MPHYRDVDDFLVGAIEIAHARGLSTPVRLPAHTRRLHPTPVLTQLAELPMGVRLRLRTRASTLVVHACATSHGEPDAQDTARQAVWVVTERHGGRERILARVPMPVRGEAFPSDTDPSESDPGVSDPGVSDGVHAVHLPLGAASSSERTVEVWLPHDARVSIRGIEADAPLTAAGPPARPRWLHYGSSISHGIGAVDALSSWPVQVARALDVDLTSFAFAGNAMLDPFVADAMAATPADVITLKVGINIVNAAAMNARTLPPALHGFVDRLRQAHPSALIVLITALACPMHEDAAGPTVWRADGTLDAYPHPSPHEGQLTLAATRAVLRDVVAVRADDDPRIVVVDGLALLGLDEGHLLSDRLHPTQEGFDLIARRFVRAVEADPTLAVAFGADGHDT